MAWRFLLGFAFTALRSPAKCHDLFFVTTWGQRLPEVPGFEPPTLDAMTKRLWHFLITKS